MQQTYPYNLTVNSDMNISQIMPPMIREFGDCLNLSTYVVFYLTIEKRNSAYPSIVVIGSDDTHANRFRWAREYKNLSWVFRFKYKEDMVRAMLML